MLFDVKLRTNENLLESFDIETKKLIDVKPNLPKDIVVSVFEAYSSHVNKVLMEKMAKPHSRNRQPTRS